MVMINTVKKCKLLPVVTVNLKDNIITVAKKLQEFQERRIFVINDKKFPVGIISIVDVNDRVVAKGKDLKKTTAKDIMTYPINIIADINEPLEDLKKKMIQHDNYYVPVTDKGVLKGLINYSLIMEVLRK